jgi:hypothetical protein
MAETYKDTIIDVQGAWRKRDTGTYTLDSKPRNALLAAIQAKAAAITEGRSSPNEDLAKFMLFGPTIYEEVLRYFLKADH